MKSSRFGEAAAFWTMIGATLFLVVVAYGLSLLLQTPFPGPFAWTARAALIGVAATAPMAMLLYRFMRTSAPFVVRFRDSQIAEFSKIGFVFTPTRIALISLAAGVSEEILFRGVLQGAAEKHLPVALAILAPNIVFGLMHARSLLYALIAGVVGCWLGLVMHLTGNLLAPIVAHALYDVIALDVTRRAIAAQPRVDVSSGSSVTG